MKTLTVTDIKVMGASGENRRPTRGIATFSDGQTYEWYWASVASRPYFFKEYRPKLSRRQVVPFESAKRASAVLAALEH